MSDKFFNLIKVILVEKNLPNKYLVEILGRDQTIILKWGRELCSAPFRNAHQITQCLDVELQKSIRIPGHNPFND